ncbi:hypothetical protein ACFU6S_03665 [Streptomyces sp. NPDC057456]|uniref:hypothetical protein n=1 Tax=Streptomyces sp. NPDC057456 TaxID=3346139 RepID=UPI0036951388
MDESLKPPPGWRIAAYPWFAMDEPTELPRLLRVGSVLLPEFFHLIVAPEDAWRTYRDGTEGAEGWQAPVLFLNFQVYEGELEMTEARSAYQDIGVVMDKVRKVIKPEKWKLLGIHYMTQYLVQFMDEGGRPEGDRMRTHADWPVSDEVDPYGNRPKAAIEWLDELQAHAAEAYASARGTPNPRRKRQRITDDFLRKVARVYGVAERAGLPPTREVASQFKAPHSTAAKWVGSARRKKFLPPVGTPVYGAYDPTIERRMEIEYELHDSLKDLTPARRRELELELETLGGPVPGREA